MSGIGDLHLHLLFLLREPIFYSGACDVWSGIVRELQPLSLRSEFISQALLRLRGLISRTICTEQYLQARSTWQLLFFLEGREFPSVKTRLKHRRYPFHTSLPDTGCVSEPLSQGVPLFLVCDAGPPKSVTCVTDCLNIIFIARQGATQHFYI